MDYKIITTDLAKQEMDEAAGYIAWTLKNPVAARSLTKKIRACYAELRQFPFLYEACRNPYSREQDCRRVVIDNFILIYRPDQRERVVYILRFFYGARDYEKLL